ncbi:MAG: helix-turn-helix domain-containing protein [Candidatus Woesearchaeota archaeon]|nr:helix-turn-helix domain-containing protein [Candidatus Woesearchaeota archaeon]
MDHETLFTASKWTILKHLEKGPASPLELSNECETSIANISQQLRLLEMAGLVTSERISNRDKGKPRILYSLAGDLSYMIATTGDFVEKKVVQLSARNKAVMKIWFYPDEQLRYTLEKAFWKLEQHLDKLNTIRIDADESAVTFYLDWKHKPVEIKPFTVTHAGTTRQVIVSTDAPPGDLYVLHTHTMRGRQ